MNASIVSSEKGTELKDKRIWNCCNGEFVGVVYYLLLKITLYRVESCVLCCWIPVRDAGCKMVRKYDGEVLMLVFACSCNSVENSLYYKWPRPKI